MIQERRQREESVTKEIAQKWGRAQVVSAPVLAIPIAIGKRRYKKMLKENLLP
nr:inner membrane CreD family protein [Sphingobacterium sp. T2]